MWKRRINDKVGLLGFVSGMSDAAYDTHLFRRAAEQSTDRLFLHQPTLGANRSYSYATVSLCFLPL